MALVNKVPNSDHDGWTMAEILENLNEKFRWKFRNFRKFRESLDGG